jgi:hypothetical protein
VFKVTFAGYVSRAVWDTCPDVGREAVGTTCTGADVMAFLSSGSEQAGSDVHLRDKRTGVVKIYTWTCVVADVEIDPGVVERTCRPISERFGRATPAPVTVDPRLTFTKAAAAVPVQVVNFADDTWTTATVHTVADFTGTGATMRLDERTHSADRYVMWRAGTRGWERGCTATAALDGQPVQGELLYCSMARVRQTEVRIYHHLPG